MKQGVFARSCVLFGVAAGAGIGGRDVGAQPVAQRVVAIAGQWAPRMEAGTVFDILGVPGIGARGDAAFVGYLRGTGNSYSYTTLWLAPVATWGGSPMLAYQGSTVTDSYIGTPGGVGPFVDAGGRVALTISVASSYHSVLAGSPGNYRTVVRAGDPAPGMPAGTTLVMNRPQPILESSGAVYLETPTSYSFNGSGPALGAFVSSVTGTGAPELVTYEGAPAPGVPGLTITSFSRPGLAAGGRVAFAALTRSSQNVNGRGVWTGTAGNLTRIAYSGMTAPGLAGDLRMNVFPSGPGVNSSGATVFTVNPVTPTGGSRAPAAYLYDDGQLTLMGGTGTPVPALGAGYTLSAAKSRRVTDRGEALLRGGTTGPGGGASAFGWYRWRGGVVTPIVQDGMAAPQLGAGVTLASTTVISFNEVGQALVRATLAGAGVDSSNNISLWAVDPLGQFSLVARTGSLMDVAGEQRVVSQIFASTTQYETNGWNDIPAAASLSDSGHVAYQLAFTNGPVANLVATLPAVIPGDANNDLVVNSADFQILYRNLYKAGDRTAGDFNGDGRVSFTDYQILERNFGRSLDDVASVGGIPAELAAMVPEPGSVGVLGVALAAGVMGRRRRGA
jgi:hypothetical protein